MEAEDDVLVFREQGIVVDFIQSMRISLHDCSLIRSTTLITLIFSSEDAALGLRRPPESPRGRIPAAGHDDIRFAVLVVAGPLPDADAFRAMHDGGLHRQPLREGVFACHHHIDVMPASQAVIKDRKQTVGVRRQVDAHDIAFLLITWSRKPGSWCVKPL